MAISTDINYPAEYLPCPLKENFGLKPTSPLKSSTMVTGRRRQRRAYTSVPSQTPVAWIFTDGQAQLFEAWVRDITMDGASWFNMPLLTPLGQQDIFVDLLMISMRDLLPKGGNTGGILRYLSFGKGQFFLPSGQSSLIL